MANICLRVGQLFCFNFFLSNIQIFRKEINRYYHIDQGGRMVMGASSFLQLHHTPKLLFEFHRNRKEITEIIIRN